MKDDIRNIINFENITRVRSSIGVTTNAPVKDSIVKLIPLEYLEQGIKVLIDGKLFIAFIEGNIPIKEEIIAQVTSTNPFSLSLNLETQLNNNKDFLVDQILRKFELKNSRDIRNVIIKVIQEGNNIIKSKILLLVDLVSYTSIEGLEYSLLINLVWSNSYKNKEIILDLFENLFDETFEEVCEGVFKTVNELLFSNLPQYINQQIKNNLIYNDKDVNPKSLLNKLDVIFALIKVLNEYKTTSSKIENSIDRFINYGAKYILQKSVLKDYDYFPDFIIVKHNTELSIIHYSIKKAYNPNNQVSYKILFKHHALPFKLSGVVRNNFLIGDVELDEELLENKTIENFEENLFSQWGFRSSISVNNSAKKEYVLSKVNSEVNKLVS